MEKAEKLYLKLLLCEFNRVMNDASFCSLINSPFTFREVMDRHSKLKVSKRLIVAAEIYRWVMGNQWRLLDLEVMLKHSLKKRYPEIDAVKDNADNLLKSHCEVNIDLLKTCLLLTGLDPAFIENPKFILQKRQLKSGNPNKLWSAIGYYDMQKKCIHVSTGENRKTGKYRYSLEDIVETAAHELGHHIYFSIISGKIKTRRGTVKNIRKYLKGIKVMRTETEHKQWLGFYKKDYAKEWKHNKLLQIIPKNTYVRFGIENEIFAEIISGKADISKNKRRDFINLINDSCLI